MTVRLNEAALNTFFRSPEGPMSRVIEGHAQEVASKAQGKVENIMHRDTSLVADLINYRMEQGEDGIQAVVFVEQHGSVAEYLAEKVRNPKEGTNSWMLEAMTEAFAD